MVVRVVQKPLSRYDRNPSDVNPAVVQGRDVLVLEETWVSACKGQRGKAYPRSQQRS
jgi:hypothetical protein